MLSDRRGIISPTDGEMELMALKSLCAHCLRQAQRAHQTLSPIFKSVDVDYFTEFYITLDKLLCGEGIPRIGHFSNKQKELIVYKLYVVFKDLAKLSDHIDKSRQASVEILTFHEHFDSLAIVWIDLAVNKCKQRIQKAISLDEQRIALGTDQACHSSSAVDTEGFLLQLGLFWKNLEWPVATEAYGYLCTIVEHISHLSLFYVDALYKHLLDDSTIMYDETGKFKSSEKLCIILNNMYHVKKTLAEMPALLELENYYVWLQNNHKGLGDQAMKLVDSLLLSHDEDIDTKISYFVDRITERLTPDISQYFEVIVPAVSSHSSLHHTRHLASILKSYSSLTEHRGIEGIMQWPWANRETEEHLTNEEAITPLLNYLTTNLQILADYLLTPVLNAILNKLWNVIMGVVHGRMIVIPRKSSALYLCKRLEYILREMKGFFHADGSGMSLDSLETKMYRFMVNRLNMLQMSSTDLMERFLWELAEQQKYLDHKSSKPGTVQVETVETGTLQVSVGYLLDKAEVEVSIIKAGDLVRQDNLNTFVEVCLQPRWIFPSSSKKNHRTQTSSGKSPFYGDEFKLPAKETELLSPGAMILMILCDSDTDRTVGICTVHGMHIPHLYAHMQTLAQGDVPERKNLTLKLFKQKESPVLKELLVRLDAGDQDIAQFVKANKRLFDTDQMRRDSTLKMWNYS